MVAIQFVQWPGTTYDCAKRDTDRNLIDELTHINVAVALHFQPYNDRIEIIFLTGKLSLINTVMGCRADTNINARRLFRDLPSNNMC